MALSLKKSYNLGKIVIFGIAIAGFGLIFPTASVKAADIVCRGTLFGDTDFTAFYGEIGFGRMELRFLRGGKTVEVPLLYSGRNSRGENIFRGNNPDQPSDVVEVIAPRNVNPQTRIQVSYNGNVFPGNCVSTLPSRPAPSPSLRPSPSPSTPVEGSFSGRGRATGSVFGGGRQADASLNFNRGNFSLGLSVPPGTGAQVNYSGTFKQLKASPSGNPNSFVLDGQVQGFASSANNLRVLNTHGTCRIEVFDGRVIDVSCHSNVRGSSTQFTGMKQF